MIVESRRYGQPIRSILALGLLGTALFLAACLDQRAGDTEMSETGMRLTPVSFGALEGWDKDDHGAALDAFRRSCGRILDAAPSRPLDPKTGAESLYGTAGDWQPVCRQAGSAQAAADPKGFFETAFRPFEVADETGPDGLITGYYEPEVDASLTRGGRYQTPLLAKPADLQRLDLGEFDPSLRGETIRGRIAGGRFVPYHDRASIERGALPHDELAVAWLADPVDAFFVHIQGSARLRLPDGDVMRVGFAEKNGRPYTAIGRILIERGALTSETVSMQTIRDWLAANPDEARTILEANQSYIFFNAVPIRDRSLGPAGAGGVPLSPGRSLAVDRRLHALGAPIWLSADLPGAPQTDHRLMIAQDTGSAIRGAVRGDFFWGSGAAAGDMAGEMKAKGRFWALLPVGLAEKEAARL
ncbi:MAG: MltA domain-containing protein [Parvibaculaceae bacterium]